MPTSSHLLAQWFGLEHPIIQAPLAGVQLSGLALAVCQAGGLGSLPGAMLSLPALEEELKRLRAGTSAPWNVNFFCHTVPEPNPLAEQTWRQALAPWLAEHGIDATTIPAGAGRMPFTHDTADVLEAFKPAVVSFHFGLPPADLLARVKSWGSKVLSSATTVAEARWLEAHGVDAIIAQGVEAGGHRGVFLCDAPCSAITLSSQNGTFSLLPQVAQAVRCPVIAAGGIADASSVQAARALGAQAVQIGTAYMLCPEAITSPLHRAAIAQARDHGAETALTNLFTGRPARGLVNRIMRALGPISASAPPFPTATAAIAPLRTQAEAQGLTDFTPLWCGQNPSGCTEESAVTLTQRLGNGW